LSKDSQRIQLDLDKALEKELVLNEPAPAHIVRDIFQLSVITIGFLAMFFFSGAPGAIIDDIVLAIKNRKITPEKIKQLVKEMKSVGLDPKKVTDPAHIAIFTKIVKKLTRAESATETRMAEKELKQALSEFWPYQRGQIRDAMNKVSKENKISLAHKIKHLFGLEE
jgi:hypothetical protein